MTTTDLLTFNNAMKWLHLFFLFVATVVVLWNWMAEDAAHTKSFDLGATPVPIEPSYGFRVVLERQDGADALGPRLVVVDYSDLEAFVEENRGYGPTLSATTGSLQPGQYTQVDYTRERLENGDLVTVTEVFDDNHSGSRYRVEKGIVIPLEFSSTPALVGFAVALMPLFTAPFVAGLLGNLLERAGYYRWLTSLAFPGTFTDVSLLLDFSESRWFRNHYVSDATTNEHIGIIAYLTRKGRSTEEIVDFMRRCRMHPRDEPQWTSEKVAGIREKFELV